MLKQKNYPNHCKALESNLAEFAIFHPLFERLFLTDYKFAITKMILEISGRKIFEVKLTSDSLGAVYFRVKSII
jgi:hypothetical protein